MPAPLTDAERAEIVALLNEHGGNRNEAARRSGRSKSVCQKIAAQEGIPSENGHTTKRATEVAAAMREIDRMEVISMGLDVGVSMLEGIKKMQLTQAMIADVVKAYKDAMTGVAIGIDKHRLETGEATNRSETVDPERRQKMRESLDEVATRRREKLAG